jgi:hypothetical protein
VNLARGFRHVALGIEVAVKRPPGREAVDELDATDLDQPIALQRIESGRFGIEDDLAHRRSACAGLPRPRRGESLPARLHFSDGVQNVAHLRTSAVVIP